MTQEPLAQTPPPLRSGVETGEPEDGLSLFTSVRVRVYSVSPSVLVSRDGFLWRSGRLMPRPEASIRSCGS